MNPADVPDELTAAGFDAIRAWWKAHPDPNCHLDDRTMMREVLAAVLPLHKQQLRAELDRTRAELSAHHAAESADAAAGSYAGRAEAAEARAQYLDEEALRLQRTIDEARKQRDDWHDEATRQRSRAEQAETALAEMRGRLGKPDVQWAVALDNATSSSLPEKLARRMASGRGTTLLTRDAYPNPTWQPADATPRTALERAADEQGDERGGGDA